MLLADVHFLVQSGGAAALQSVVAEFAAKLLGAGKGLAACKDTRHRLLFFHKEKLRRSFSLPGQDVQPEHRDSNLLPVDDKPVID